jgi:hypothetical protein
VERKEAEEINAQRFEHFVNLFVFSVTVMNHQRQITKQTTPSLPF